MAINRYYTINGQQYSMSSLIYKAVQNNQIDYETRISVLGDRLDHIAYSQYKNANYWWIIASASGIGWWLQIPANVILHIPKNIEEIIRLRDSAE